MKRKVLTFILTGLVSLGIVEEVSAETPLQGMYHGKILKLTGWSGCKLSQGDRRACEGLTVRLDSGKVIDVRLWGGGTKLYNSQGNLLYNDKNDSGAELSNHFHKVVVTNFKAGTNVRMDVFCGNPDAPGCSVNAIYLK